MNDDPPEPTDEELAAQAAREGSDGVAFTALMERFARIELAGEPDWWTNRSDQRGLHSLPVRLAHS